MVLATAGTQESQAALDFVMSDFSLTLVLQFKTSKIINDMAKVQIKSEKVTPFGGIFHVRVRGRWALPNIITSVVARQSSDGEANCKM